jgi:Phage integrase, N-terminal SAM-like domain
MKAAEYNSRSPSQREPRLLSILAAVALQSERTIHRQLTIHCSRSHPNKWRNITSFMLCYTTPMTEPMYQFVPVTPSTAVGSTTTGIVVPLLIADAGDQAARRFLEFFAVTIRNTNIRMAYYRAVLQFFAWCDRHQLGQLVEIEPLHVAAYIEGLQKTFAKPSVKQYLAAIRMLFDWLVTGGIVATNPAHAVKRGKTPVLTPAEARALLDSIDTATVVGLRDRALRSVMVFTFARIGAVVAMRVEDYYPQGKRWWVWRGPRFPMGMPISPCGTLSGPSSPTRILHRSFRPVASPASHHGGWRW